MSQPDKEKSNPSSSSSNLSVLPPLTERAVSRWIDVAASRSGGTVCGENKSHHASVGSCCDTGGFL